jgi:hypothetical protein
MIPNNADPGFMSNSVREWAPDPVAAQRLWNLSREYTHA